MNLINTEFTLLIVDDEKQNRLLLTELFGTTYKIIQAKNGVQALEKARQHRPDLILLDVLMPEMDGMDVLRELKRDDATRLIPVIFITALDSATDEENGLNLGAVDYISKPFHPPIVRVRVRNQLQLVHQRRLLEQLASLDGLTGIPNRRQFDATLLKEWHRCQRNQQPLSLIVAQRFESGSVAAPRAAGSGRHLAPSGAPPRRPGGPLRRGRICSAAARNRCHQRPGPGRGLATTAAQQSLAPPRFQPWPVADHEHGRQHHRPQPHRTRPRIFRPGRCGPVPRQTPRPQPSALGQLSRRCPAA